MATLKLKVIKSKVFTANEVEHTHYTVAHKGRIFGFNTLKFDTTDFTINNGVLTINVDIEALRESKTDQLTGEITNFISIVPKMDLALATF